MSGSAKAGTIAERHACELRVLPEFAGARSSEARFRRIFFSLTKTYMDVGHSEVKRGCFCPVPRRSLPANEQIRSKSKLPPSCTTPERSRRMDAFLCFLRQLIRAAHVFIRARETRWSQ